MIRFKEFFSALAIVGLAFALPYGSSTNAEAGSPVTFSIHDSSQPFLQQGDISITEAMVDSMLEERVPAEDRAALLNSPQRIAQLLENLIRVTAFYQRADGLGLLDDDTLQREMQRAILLRGADRYRRHFFETTELESYESLAREIFLVEPHHFLEPSTFDFWHVLIRVDGESDEIEAMRRAINAFEVLESSDQFQHQIESLTDDPTFSENAGLFRDIDLDVLVPQLAATLSEGAPGRWLSPVRSSFGWHLVRIQSVNEGAQMDWSVAKTRAESIARERHLQLALERLFREIGSEPVEFAEGAIARLRERHGGQASPVTDDQELLEAMKAQ